MICQLLVELLFSFIIWYTDPTYDKYSNQTNSGIIAKQGIIDNYPLGTNDMNIKPPIIPDKILDPNAAYQENKYIRDQSVNNAINELKNEDEDDYKEVSNAYNNFLLPIDSNDELHGWGICLSSKISHFIGHTHGQGKPKEFLDKVDEYLKLNNFL